MGYYTPWPRPDGDYDDFLSIWLEAPPGFEPGMEVLQTSALPLGDGAGRTSCFGAGESGRVLEGATTARARAGEQHHQRSKDGAGNGIRTRDFDLGKVALYH